MASGRARRARRRPGPGPASRLGGGRLPERVLSAVQRDRCVQLSLVGGEVALHRVVPQKNSAFWRGVKVISGEGPQVEQAQAEAVDERRTELFEEVQGERGPAIVDL